MNKVQGTRPGAGADVVVVGEALIDIVVSSQGTVEHPGGSPANVAYGLGRLNVPTALLTSIGDDHHGAAIERHLASAGVELLTAAGRPGRTATATATLASDGSAQYDFDIQWELPAIAPVTLPKILHTGSIATFLEPGASAVRELLEQVHQRCVVTYDPNVRPALLGSQTEAKTIFEDLIPLHRGGQTQRRGRAVALPGLVTRRHFTAHLGPWGRACCGHQGLRRDPCFQPRRAARWFHP